MPERPRRMQWRSMKLNSASRTAMKQVLARSNVRKQEAGRLFRILPFLLTVSLPLVLLHHSLAGEERASTLRHGIATTEVGSRSALVWFRTEGPASVTIQWEPDSQGDRQDKRRSHAVVTKEDRDFTGFIRLSDLTPATVYQYRVFASQMKEGDAVRVKPAVASGRFMTAALPETHEGIRFVWGGDLFCRKQGQGYRVFDRMLQANPDFALLVGDLVYSDVRCPSPPNVPGSDFVATTLDEYRAKHRYQRGDRAFQRFLASVPVYAIWDDHEVRNNFSGPHEPLTPVGRQAFLDYWPVDASQDDPHRLYRKIRHGKDLELFILDTCQYRSPNDRPDGTAKTLLGKAQRQWLIKGLIESSAMWKVIVSTVPLSIPKGGTKRRPGIDSWARGEDGTGFHIERAMVVNAIVSRQIRNVVWLATDVHFTQVIAYDPDGDGQSDFHEFICGPLSSSLAQPRLPEPSLNPRVLYSAGGFLNFGLLAVDKNNLSLDMIDEQGKVKFHRTFQAGDKQ